MSKVRIGLDDNRPEILDVVRAFGGSVLISANNLWDARPRKSRPTGKFRDTSFLDGLDVALDSGGFVAMKKYGRFRYSVRQYLALVQRMNPTWWASMDFCCEPDCPIGGANTFSRQIATAALWGTLWHLSRELGMASRPMPVIQGWHPHEYVRCAGMLWEPVHWTLWPGLIGVGSVCRRKVGGRDGIVKVVEALDDFLPKRFKFHLFGVKSEALSVLADHPRFGAMDSSSYDAGNRHKHCRAGNRPRPNAARAAALRKWYVEQRDRAHPLVDLLGEPLRDTARRQSFRQRRRPRILHQSLSPQLL